ncbi:MAG: hypothetical protein WCJ19_05020 [bacterium]
MTNKSHFSVGSILKKATVVAATGGLVLSLAAGTVNAAGVANMTVALSNSAVNSTSTVTVSWTSVNAYAANDTISIVWPAAATASGSQFGQSGALVSGDVTGLPASLDFTSSGTGTLLLTAKTTIASATALSFTFGGSKLTTPTAAGNFPIAMYSAQAGVATADSATGLAYVGNANQVHITARVTPTLSFDIRSSSDGAVSTFPAACDLGTLSTSSINHCEYRLKVATNAENGFVVSYASSANGLYNGTYTFTPANSGSTASLTAGTEKYGASIVPGSVTGNNAGSIAATSSVTVSAANVATNAASYQATSATSIYEATRGNSPAGTDTDNTALVTHLATPSATTPAGTYAQTITYSIVGRF